MSELHNYLTYKSLAARYETHDALADTVHDKLELANVCFKVTDDFKQNLDRICTNLGCSRREFLTRATVYAMEQADRIYESATADLVDLGGDQE